jgi:hypothetical protein
MARVVGRAARPQGRVEGAALVGIAAVGVTGNGRRDGDIHARGALSARRSRTAPPSCDIRPVFVQIGQNERFVAE